MRDELQEKTVILPPFKHFIMTVGLIPTSYLESMTYYEMLVWFTNYLGKTVIPAINENGEAVTELQDLFVKLQNYVNDYFDNLDVQEEINNKLDGMVEDGILPEIIASYLNSKAIFGFDNVSLMKQATNLINGSYAKTLGYYDKNDDGEALYKIRNITNDDVVDEKKIIALTNSNILIAELITNNIIPEQIGAYADGIHDDSIILQYAFDNFNVINLSKKIYRADNINIPYGKILNGNNATIKGINSNNAILKLNYDTRISNIILNGNINENEYNNIGLLFNNDCFRNTIDNLTVTSCNYGIKDTNGCWSMEFTKVHIQSCEYGLNIYNGSSTSINIDNFLFENCGLAFAMKGVHYSNINTLCGDYCNGAEEESWPYQKAYGNRNNPVIKFEGCRGININSLGGENNVGYCYASIHYSKISINTANIYNQISYKNSNKALFVLDDSINELTIGPIYYLYGPSPESKYDYYYDYAYAINTYGIQNYSLLIYRNGNPTPRTPNRIIKKESNIILSQGFLNTIADQLTKPKNATHFVIEFERDPNLSIPININFALCVSNNIDRILNYSGEILGKCIYDNSLDVNCKIHGYNNTKQYLDSITPIIDGTKIKIPIESNDTKEAFINIFSLGFRTKFTYYFETNE